MGLPSFGPEDYTAGPAQDQQQWKSVGSGPQMLTPGSHRGDSYAPLRVLLSHLPENILEDLGSRRLRGRRDYLPALWEPQRGEVLVCLLPHHFCEERVRTESLLALEQLTLKENRRTLVAFHTDKVHVAFAPRCSFQLPTKERSASHVYESRRTNHQTGKGT